MRIATAAAADSWMGPQPKDALAPYDEANERVVVVPVGGKLLGLAACRAR